MQAPNTGMPNRESLWSLPWRVSFLVLLLGSIDYFSCWGRGPLF